MPIAAPTINMIATDANIRALIKSKGLKVADVQTVFGFNTPQAIFKWMRGDAIGDELNGFYPVIDFQKGNTIVSLKTLNPSASSYTPSKIIDKIDKYAESLGNFVLDNGTELCKTKILDIRVPNGTLETIDLKSLKDIEDTHGVIIKIGEF